MTMTKKSGQKGSNSFPPGNNSMKQKKKARIQNQKSPLKHEFEVCSSENNLEKAIYLYESAISKNLFLSNVEFNIITRLCSEPKVLKCPEKKALGIDYGFRVFEKMRSLNIVPMAGTFSHLVRLAVAKNDPDYAFELIKSMRKDHGFTPYLKTYTPVLLCYCENLKADDAYRVEENIMANGLRLEEGEIYALLRVSMEVGRGEKVYEYLHKLRGLGMAKRELSEGTAKLLEKWFQDPKAAELGVEEWDVNRVREERERKGGEWHGLGWLGKGPWEVKRVINGNDGKCCGCDEKLVGVGIDLEETKQFAESVARLAVEREAGSDFKSFMEWIEKSSDKYDVVIDGANVGFEHDYQRSNQHHFAGAGFKIMQLEALVNDLYKRHKKWPLVILYGKRLHTLQGDPSTRKMIEDWLAQGILYATPVGSNDDWYWLYAALKLQCFLVTNDLMRDHMFELLGNTFFPRWKERRQVRYSFVNGVPQLKIPVSCPVFFQESERGSWHIPIASKITNDNLRTWLCITRSSSSIKKLSHCGKPEPVSFNDGTHKGDHVSDTNESPNPISSHLNMQKTPNRETELQNQYELVMATCLKQKDLQKAIYMYESALAQNLCLSTIHFNFVLKLCSDQAILNSEKRAVALEYGFRVFDKMQSLNIPLNLVTITHVVRLAVAKDDPEYAFELVKSMKTHRGLSPNMKIYRPVLLCLCKNLRANEAFAIEEDMEAFQLRPGEGEITALFKLSLEVGKFDRAYEYLQKLRGVVELKGVREDIAGLIEKCFCGEKAADVGVMEWDGGKVREERERRGGVWHGFGWLGKGQWKVQRVQIREDGWCHGCNEQLVPVNVDSGEIEQCADSVAGLALKKEKNSTFKSFMEWIEKHAGYYDRKVVVDGENIAFYSRHQVRGGCSGLVLEAVVRKLYYMTKTWPLVIVRSRYFSSLQNNPLTRKLTKELLARGMLYVTPDGANYDSYWLYAALRLKCLLVTNDERPHPTFELLRSSSVFFLRWKERFQIGYSFVNGIPQIRMPRNYSILIQESERGSWHIPTALPCETTSEHLRRWLCITRPGMCTPEASNFVEYNNFTNVDRAPHHSSMSGGASLTGKRKVTDTPLDGRTNKKLKPSIPVNLSSQVDHGRASPSTISVDVHGQPFHVPAQWEVRGPSLHLVLDLTQALLSATHLPTSCVQPGLAGNQQWQWNGPPAASLCEHNGVAGTSQRDVGLVNVGDGGPLISNRHEASNGMATKTKSLQELFMENLANEPGHVEENEGYSSDEEIRHEASEGAAAAMETKSRHDLFMDSLPNCEPGHVDEIEGYSSDENEDYCPPSNDKEDLHEAYEKEQLSQSSPLVDFQGVQVLNEVDRESQRQNGQIVAEKELETSDKTMQVPLIESLTERTDVEPSRIDTEEVGARGDEIIPSSSALSQSTVDFSVGGAEENAHAHLVLDCDNTELVSSSRGGLTIAQRVHARKQKLNRELKNLQVNYDK